MRKLYSVIVPIWDPEHKMADTITRCLESVYTKSFGVNHELILVWNVMGYPRAVNHGLHRAKGDYLIVLNDDVVIKDYQWLDKMGAHEVSGWRMIDFHLGGKDPDAACWGMSREAYEKIGDLDEQFCAGYGYEDSDYWIRARDVGYNLGDAGVSLEHLENKTFQTYLKTEKDEMTAKNEKLFKEKWGL